MNADTLSQTEAAAALGISDRTLRKWETRGKIARTTDEEGRPVYLRSDVDALRKESGSRAEGSPQGEEVASLRAERDRLADEVTWLRSRIEGAERAAEQLRVVTAQQAEALRLALEPKALPPAEASPSPARGAAARVPWWQFWKTLH